MLTKEQFDDLARQEFTHVPLKRELLADFDTPLSTYYRLAREPYTYLYESVQGGEKWGRYSIIGLPTKTRVEVHAHTVTLLEADQIVDQWESDDPLEDIKNFHERFKTPQVEGLPKFTGGLVGFFGYDTVRYIEPTLASGYKDSDLDIPDICLMVSDEVVVFDNLAGRLFIVVYVDVANGGTWESGIERLDGITRKLRSPIATRPSILLQHQPNEAKFESMFGQQAYEEAVEKSREYILAGDVFQVVISQRLSATFTGNPIDLYRALRTLNPSPYMYYLNFDSYHIVGASPEILVRSEEGHVTVRPLAGTRPRGASEEEDQELIDDLLADEKERAEHVMLVDLGRNDVGRVSKLATVKVSDIMQIERYSHVMHIVSNVEGELDEGMHAIDVLRATLPAGTVSGAPKVRAMEIIDELEPHKRGIYAGAVGYISWDGNLDTAIAIRTAVLVGDQVYVQAGAGLVVDSVPQTEWHETMHKARAILRAVAIAEVPR
ncbi:MAG: anthranilate synthase component I [Acidiferrobacterales bacterium]|nr:anthranilate synthase component I [Acidiferrobacterales bacterium]